jgi:hypothetical protein
LDKDHPLLNELVELADSLDMATLAAERGNISALNAWLEDIRDDAAKLAEKTPAPATRLKRAKSARQRGTARLRPRFGASIAAKEARHEHQGNPGRGSPGHRKRA